MDELKTSSLVVIENDPCYYKEYDKRLDYIDNNWDFCFEYLNKELIIDIICRYANEDQVLLASMIKTFKYSDVRTAAELTGLAVYIEEAYGVDIFNPIITDENKVRTVDSDTKNSKLFYRNKAGNFKMAHV